MERLKGVFCALWTPTDATGEVLWSAWERNLAFVLDAGVDGIMALGSTAEFLQLDVPQRKELLTRLIALCRKHGRRVIANVSDVQIRHVIELGRHAKAAGADCVSILPPWYFPTEQRDLAEFFLTAARAIQAPLMLYNYPEVTGKKIELETIEAVAKEVEVVAVKQSGGEFDYHHGLLQLGKRLGYGVLTGSDTRFEETLRLGCAGTISGLANALPAELCRIFSNFEKGRSSPDETQRIARMAEAIAPLKFPLNVKATIEAGGVETGVPKWPISAETKKIYDAVVAKLSAA